MAELGRMVRAPPKRTWFVVNATDAIEAGPMPLSKRPAGGWQIQKMDGTGGSVLWKNFRPFAAVRV